jgi:hypothetical protein
MDLYKAIQDLYVEKEKLERIIASLEELQRSAQSDPSSAPKATSRRGRKSMSHAERQEVSERMKRYWEARRKNQEEKTHGATS